MVLTCKTANPSRAIDGGVGFTDLVDAAPVETVTRGPSYSLLVFGTSVKEDSLIPEGTEKNKQTNKKQYKMKILKVCFKYI